MSTALKFEVESRKTTGTGSARAARRDSLIPAVVYGAGKNAVHVNLPRKDFSAASQKAGFKSTVITLVVDGKELKALTKEIQYHPVTDAIQHVDLINLSEKGQVRVYVPTKFVGAEKSPGVKRGGIVNIVRRQVELFCDANKIPASLVFSLEGREIGDSVHINDIELPEGVRPVIKRNFTIMTLLGKGGSKANTTEGEGEAAAGTAAPAAAKPAAKK